MESERPRKIYELTSQGKNLLGFTENSLNLIYKKMANDSAASIEMSATGNNVGSIRYQNRTTLAHATLHP